jgi:nicotinate-nucleotide adenylyltransferase
MVVAELAREVLDLDRVVWIPNNTPPHKTPSKVDGHHRLRMVNLAVEENGRFEASSAELDRGGVSYTVDTLEDLARDPSNELFLIVGADGLAAFESWYRPKRILELATLAVYPRLGYEVESGKSRFFENAIQLETPIVEISSSVLRKRLGAGLTVRYLVPAGVLRYINENSLYT